MVAARGRLSIRARRQGRRSVHQGAIQSSKTFEACYLRAGKFCLGRPSHFFENIRKQGVLPRLIGLSRHGAPLRSIGVIKAILPQTH